MTVAEAEFRDTLQPTRKDITYQEILNALLDSKDLDLKTHINRPKELSLVKTIAIFFESLELIESGLLLQTWIEILNTYMVSFRRESRKEIIRAIANVEKSIEGAEKLTTNLK